MTNIHDTLTGTATKLGEGATGLADEVQARAEDAWNSVQHRTDRAVRESSEYVHRNPLPTALAAFAVGLVLGLALNRREPVSFQDRYVAEPLHHSRGLLLGLVLACGTLLRRTLASASSAAESAGHDLQDALKPVSKAARQTGRKLGL